LYSIAGTEKTRHSSAISHIDTNSSDITYADATASRIHHLDTNSFLSYISFQILESE
jgi:hypothetical protein